MFYSHSVLALVHSRIPLCPVVQFCWCFYLSYHDELTLRWQKKKKLKQALCCMSLFLMLPIPQTSAQFCRHHVVIFSHNQTASHTDQFSALVLLLVSWYQLQSSEFNESAQLLILPLWDWYWYCWTPRQDSLALITHTNEPGLFLLPEGTSTWWWWLPHGSLYPRHLGMVSEVAENNPAEPPAPLHPPGPGGQDTAVPDPHGAAVPGQGSHLLVSHFLQQNTAHGLVCVPWDTDLKIQTQSRHRHLMDKLCYLTGNFNLSFSLSVPFPGIPTVNVNWATWRPPNESYYTDRTISSH